MHQRTLDDGSLLLAGYNFLIISFLLILLCLVLQLTYSLISHLRPTFGDRDFLIGRRNPELWVTGHTRQMPLSIRGIDAINLL